MKTGQHYFDTLTEDTRIKFKKNATAVGMFDYVMLMNWPNMYRFVSTAFSFVDTPEGFDFWLEVAEGKRK